MSLKEKDRDDIQVFQSGLENWVLLIADEFEPDISFESRAAEALRILGEHRFKPTTEAERIRNAAWAVRLTKKPCPTCHREW